MPFNTEYANKSSNFEKVNYLKLSPGIHIIRLLEDPASATVITSHFVLGKYSIRCLDEDCPICANNKKIILENPDDYREVKGYYPKARHFVVNVLDRTMVKVCPNCQAEVKKADRSFPASCPECNTMLAGATPNPSGKVKLLTIGVTLATQLNGVEKSVTTDDGDPIGLTNFDLSLAVEGTGRQRVITPIAYTQHMDHVEVPKEAFNDPENSIIRLQPEEVSDLLRGVSLKDIYAARKPAKTNTADKPGAGAVKAKIDSIFQE